jgi:predicted TIM-barrel fold metal-dependent hydrolase
MTTQTQTNPLYEALQGFSVIDCDTHYTEPPDLWTSRAPAKYRDQVPHLRRVNDADMWYVAGDIVLGPVGLTVVTEGGEKVLGKLGIRDFSVLERAAYEVGPRLQMMDRLGIHAQIVYPNASGFASAAFLRIPDEELRTLCTTIYNDAVAEWQAESGGRLFPQAILPFWDLDATLAEMRRCTEDLKLKGFTITDTPERVGLPDYGTAHWEPFWELANDLRAPLNFHIGSAGGGFSPFIDSPWPSMGRERKMAIGATCIYLDNARMISNLLFSGLFDRYPNLKLVSVESGIGWIPFVIEAAEYQLDEMCPNEGKALQRRPTEYFRDHIYACFWFEDYGPRVMMDKIGVNNILFETDFPHPTCLYPKSQEHLASILADLSEETRRRVLQENASELYGIPV